MRKPTLSGGNITGVEALNLHKQVQAEIKARETATRQLASSKQALKRSQAQTKAIERERDSVKRQLQQRDQTLAAKDSEIGALKQQRQEVQARLSGKDSQIAGLNAEIADLKRGNKAAGELVREKAVLTNEVATLRGELASRDTLISQHLAEIQRLKDAPPIAAAPIDTADEKPVTVAVAAAMTNIGSQVADAQTTLKANHNFGISNVNVVLKGKTDDAGQIKLYGPLDAGRATGLDEINFGINPGTGTSDASSDKVIVPDLQGLTLGAATRVLSSLGLRIDSASGQAPRNQGLVSGQAYRQTPAAQAAVDRGATILVVFNQ